MDGKRGGAQGKTRATELDWGEEGEKQRGGRDKQTERENVCVCVCTRARGRLRASDSVQAIHTILRGGGGGWAEYMKRECEGERRGARTYFLSTLGTFVCFKLELYVQRAYMCHVLSLKVCQVYL
jgi:hypothetical protein